LPLTADALAAIEAAAAALGEHHDPAVRRIGSWLSSFPAELLAVLGAENGSGYSARQAAILRHRDSLLRRAGLPAVRLAAELGRYRSDAWPRDRTREACPYSANDRRSLYWGAFKALDRPLSVRRIRQIVQ
jgi:hypothetical protein